MPTWDPFFQVQLRAPIDAFNFVNAEAATYVAAMAVQPNSARKTLIDTLIGSLKTAGVWTLLDFFYLPAAHDAAAALINAKNPGTFNATTVASPTFTADQGYAGNGTTSYLNTNFTPSTAAGQYALNSAHLGIWSRSNAVAATVAMGGRTTASTEQGFIILRNATGFFDLRLNTSVGPTIANSNSSGHFIARRSSSTVVLALRNAVSLGAMASDTSTAVPAVPLFIGALNNAGTASSFNTYQFAAAHAGANLTDQNATDLYNALQTYMTAVGA